jgi:hypothetical protein
MATRLIAPGSEGHGVWVTGGINVKRVHLYPALVPFEPFELQEFKKHLGSVNAHHVCAALGFPFGMQGAKLINRRRQVHGVLSNSNLRIPGRKRVSDFMIRKWRVHKERGYWFCILGTWWIRFENWERAIKWATTW